MWQYTLADLTENDDPEQWATELAEQGWQMWVRTGVLVTIGGRQVRRYNLRRWVSTKKAPRREEHLPER